VKNLLLAAGFGFFGLLVGGPLAAALAAAVAAPAARAVVA